MALFTDLWAAMFSADESVLSNARLFLRIAGPVLPPFGAGMTLYFAHQGSGKMLGPVFAAPRAWG